MKNPILPLLATVSGGLLCVLLMRESPPGINYFLLGLPTLFLYARRTPGRYPSSTGLYILAGLIATLLAQMFHPGWWNSFWFILAATALVGQAQLPQLRSLHTAILLAWPMAFFGLLQIPQQILGKRYDLVRILSYWLRVLVLPLGILMVFLLLYTSASPMLADFLEGALTTLLKSMPKLLYPIHLILFGFGFMLFGGLLFRAGSVSMLQRWIQPRAEGYHRLDKRTVSYGPSSLKRAYYSALMTLGLANGLLLLVNIIDLPQVWLASQFTAAELSQFVHAGTYALLFSISLASAILLYIFQGNLNLYPRASGLRFLALLWLLQNAILALSVGARNYHYFTQYGLTHLRIGVWVMVALTTFGLWTIGYKIVKRKTIYHTLRVNGLVLFLTCSSLGLLPWGRIITDYNLAHPPAEGLDFPYLVQLPDDNIPQLDQYIAERGDWLISEEAGTAAELLENKIERWRKKEAGSDWRAWSLDDLRVKNYLQAQGSPLVE